MRKGAYKMPKVLKKLFKVDLQMFNDGGASGGAEGSQAVAENAPKTDNKPSGSSRRSKSGEFDNVVFGKQESTPSEEATSLEAEGKPTGAGKTDVVDTSDTLEARRKAYNDLINGEYKDLDQERFQQVFDRRFKQVKGMEAELAENKEIVDLLKSRYGVDSVADVKKAFKEDYDFWERAAEEEGMTYEQHQLKLKQDEAIRKLERENAEFKAIQQRQIGEQRAKQQIDAWNEEAKAVKQIYPNFDIRTEVKNEQFLGLLKNGISMEHAYRVLHFEELTNDVARMAAKTADAQARERIKQKASRPSENGTSSKSAIIVKNDVSSLTRKDRAEIARRVARGEKIIF